MTKKLKLLENFGLHSLTMGLKFSTANHPQTDGQIECIFLEEIPITIGLQLIIIGQILRIQHLFPATYIDPQPG